MQTLIAAVYIFALCLSVSVGLVSAYMAFTADALGRNHLTGLLVLSSVLAMGTIGESLSIFGTQLTTFWVQIELTALAFLPPVFAIFAYKYTGLKSKLDIDLEPEIYVIPAITTIVVWTSPYHNLMFSNQMTREQLAFVSLSTQQWGPWFTIHSAYGYLLLVITSAWFIRFIIFSDMYVQQTVAIAAGILLPLTAEFITEAGVYATPFAVTQSTLWISNLLIGFGVYYDESSPAVLELGKTELTELLHMQSPAVIVDSEAQILEVNEAFAELFDRGSSELHGMDLTDVLKGRYPDDDDEIQIQASLEERAFDVTSSELAAEETNIGELLVLNEVTTRKRRNQQLQVMNRVLRHNIRNDLSAPILGSEYIEASVTNETPNADEIIDATEDIGQTCREVIQTANKVRELQVEPGECTVEELEVSGRLQSIVDDISKEYSEVEFKVSCPDEVPIRSAKKIAAAIAELVENAAQHNDSESPWVEVNVGVGEERTHIEIKDNGPGLSAYEREVLNNQAEDALTHASGVGLWCSNWIVKMSGGRISFDVDDVGTSVVVELQTAGEETEELPWRSGSVVDEMVRLSV